MTTKTIPGCVLCRHPAECDAFGTGGTHHQRENADPCAPIIDAEKCNKALRIVARIRERNGPDELTDTTDLEILLEKRR